MSVIPKNPQSFRGGALPPLGPLPGFYPRPAGDLKRSPDPVAYSRPPLTTNPGSAPVDDMLFTIISSNYHESSLERYVLPGIVYEWSFAMSTVLLKIKFGTVVSQFMSKYGFIGIS
jgi:hypothetical protein